ncbi:hypothetical protein M427DRAFT_472316 [Gonapodya prolifera JEL478]|uniref:CBM21 domain-containing protein n=1 Tax=Gonapodya prolifera (strain JEL478) TaxID=1344416 RepID=A0A139AR72_GONPJ|nr:hypothetical protein M427DRAFT_472316 [Gonapodya prolifera JEL478]|eukprot:KXS19236.1 hypothetical protein M427DRAFT_472316 [Gonapodya prolifera JEL478]
MEGVVRVYVVGYEGRGVEGGSRLPSPPLSGGGEVGVSESLGWKRGVEWDSGSGDEDEDREEESMNGMDRERVERGEDGTTWSDGDVDTGSNSSGTATETERQPHSETETETELDTLSHSASTQSHSESQSHGANTNHSAPMHAQSISPNAHSLFSVVPASHASILNSLFANNISPRTSLLSFPFSLNSHLSLNSQQNSLVAASPARDPSSLSTNPPSLSMNHPSVPTPAPTPSPSPSPIAIPSASTSPSSSSSPKSSSPTNPPLHHPSPTRHHHRSSPSARAHTPTSPSSPLPISTLHLPLDSDDDSITWTPEVARPGSVSLAEQYSGGGSTTNQGAGLVGTLLTSSGEVRVNQRPLAHGSEPLSLPSPDLRANVSNIPAFTGPISISTSHTSAHPSSSLSHPPVSSLSPLSPSPLLHFNHPLPSDPSPPRSLSSRQAIGVLWRDDEATREMFGPDIPRNRERSPGGGHAGPRLKRYSGSGGDHVGLGGGLGLNGGLAMNGVAGGLHIPSITMGPGPPIGTSGPTNRTLPPATPVASLMDASAPLIASPSLGMRRVQSAALLPSPGGDQSRLSALSRPLAALVPSPPSAVAERPGGRGGFRVEVDDARHPTSPRPSSPTSLPSSSPPSSSPSLDLGLSSVPTLSSAPSSLADLASTPLPGFAPPLQHRSSAPPVLFPLGTHSPVPAGLGLRRAPSTPGSPRFTPPVLPPPGQATPVRGRRGPRGVGMGMGYPDGSPGSGSGSASSPALGEEEGGGWSGYASSVLDVVPRTKGGKLVRPVLRSGRKVGNASHAKKSVLFENQELRKVVLFEKSDIPNTIPTNPKYTMVDPDSAPTMPVHKYDIVLRKGLEDGTGVHPGRAVNPVGNAKQSSGGGQASGASALSQGSVPTYVAPPTESSAVFAHFVHLHSLKLVDDKIVSGEVLVRNVAYEKVVGIRYSLDFWKSYTDLPCEYKTFHETIAGYDVFGFHLDLRELFFSVFERQHLSLSSTFAPSQHGASPLARSLSGSNLALITTSGSPTGVASSGGVWSYLAIKGLSKALRESVGKQQKLTMSFAVYYRAAGGEWWDNNGGPGNNYEVELIRTPTAQTLQYLANLPSNSTNNTNPGFGRATSDGPPTFSSNPGGASSVSMGTTALGLHINRPGRGTLQTTFSFPPQQTPKTYFNHVPPTISPLWINPNAVAAAVAASAGGNVSVPPPPPMPKWGSWVSDDQDISGDEMSGLDYGDEISESGFSEDSLRSHQDRVTGAVPGPQFVVFDDGDAGAGKSPRQYVYKSIFLDAGSQETDDEGGKDIDVDIAGHSGESVDHGYSVESSDVSTGASTTPRSTPENSPVRPPSGGGLVPLLSEGLHARMPTKWMSQTLSARRFSPERGLPLSMGGGDAMLSGGGGPIRIGRASSAPPPASFYDVFFPAPTSPVMGRTKRAPQLIVVDGHKITSGFSDGSPTSPEADAPANGAGSPLMQLNPPVVGFDHTLLSPHMRVGARVRTRSWDAATAKAMGHDVGVKDILGAEGASALLRRSESWEEGKEAASK